MAPEKPKTPSPDIYYTRALENEKSGDLQVALLNLEIASSLSPENDTITRKIDEVKAEIRTRADTHFKRGLDYYQKSSSTSARKEFLIALRYNPDHQEALNYLKNILPGNEYMNYRVENEESLRDIARSLYNDPTMDFLIAYFNDLDSNAKLSPGSILRIPILESDLTTQRIDFEKELQRGEAFFNKKKYEEAVSIAHKILEYDPTNAKAVNLIDASYYAMGDGLRREGKYLESLEMFQKVAPDYRNVQRIVSEVKRIIEEQAEEHYREGVKFFVNEELDKAIEEWEKTLTLNPDHKKAKNDIKNTRTLLEKLRKVK